MSTSNFTKLLKYCLFQAVFFICLYYGYFKGVEGAENIALFIAWFTIIASWFMLSEDMMDFRRESPPVIPQAIGISLDMAAIGVFVWAGDLMTGIFYAIHMFIIIIARDKAKEPKEETPPETKER